MFEKSIISKFSYYFVIILAIFFIFLIEKNIFIFFNNEKKINSYKILLEDKNKIKHKLEKKISSFANSEVYKELILKEKLFLKDENDKLIFYKLDE